MTREELREKRNRTIESLNDIKAVLGLDELYIAELEEKISVLLSCKNCSENKGGFICQKEYEDKCLAQKIQYIKELQEENEELKADNKEWEKASDKWKINYFELKAQVDKMKDCQNCKNDIFLAHEEPCLHCTRCFASEGKENVSDKWELEE